MISEAIWDTRFFKYPVGILYLKGKDNLNFQQFIIDAKYYKLVYVYSEFEMESIPGLNLMDKKITYTKNIINGVNSDEIIEFDSNIHSFDELLKLVYLSGSYSRFKKDNNFLNNEFSLLYKEWLNKCIKNNTNYKILIKFLNSKIAGFAIIKLNDNISVIELIAVSENFQKRNIGTELIQKCEFISKEQNIPNIEVSTQFENKPARRLYERNNFEINKITYIYHFWNKEFK